VRPSVHTTPESRDLFALMAEGAELGATELVTEVSSHALDQQREWLVSRTRLDIVNAVNCPQIQRIGRQAVKRVSGHAEHFAMTNLIRRIRDERSFRIGTTYLYDFGVQSIPSHGSTS